jgi:ribosomal protein S18 acetylase RimI-like enzyme
MPSNRKITVLDQLLDGEALKLLMLSVDGLTIGSCQIASWNEDQPSILGILIDPSHRGQGHGSALIQSAIDHAKANGRSGLSLTVEKENAQAIHLYRRAGFAVDLEDPMQLWMSIKLTPQRRDCASA